MEPLSDKKINQIIKKNPRVTRQMIDEYQDLLAEKFEIGPESQLRNRRQLERADEVRRKIRELSEQIFSGY